VGGAECPDSYSKSHESESGIAERFPTHLRDPRHQVLRNEAGSVMGQDESVFNHSESLVKADSRARGWVTREYSPFWGQSIWCIPALPRPGKGR
jgi:hypothetical protein